MIRYAVLQIITMTVLFIGTIGLIISGVLQFLSVRTGQPEGDWILFLIVSSVLIVIGILIHAINIILIFE